MTAKKIADEARAEAEKRYPDLAYPMRWNNSTQRVRFVEGAEWQASLEAAPFDTDLPSGREKLLDEVFTNLADQGWDVSMADDPVKGLSILVQPVQLTPEALALAQNIVNQVLGGAVECGAYVLADMTKRQEFNDVADAFVAKLVTGTSQPVQVEITDEMVEQAADMLLEDHYESCTGCGQSQDSFIVLARGILAIAESEADEREPRLEVSAEMVNVGLETHDWEIFEAQQGDLGEAVEIAIRAALEAALGGGDR
jgi:hypothetical protein